MGKDDLLHVKYTRAFRNDSVGLSLYHPHPAADLKPGVCGFFNREGKWQTLFNLDDVPTERGITRLNGVTVDEKPPIEHKWGIKVSESMARVKLEARIQAGAPVGPANIAGGLGYTYKNTSDTGAVLLAEPPVVQRSLPAFEEKYHEWCRVNAKALVENWPDIKKFGFCIIQSTYSTTKWGLMASTTKNELVRYAVNARIEGVVPAEMEASVLWQETGKLGGWQFSPEGVDGLWGALKRWWYNTEPQKWVVIVNGLWYKYSVLATVARMDRLRRGKRPATFGPADDQPHGTLTDKPFNSMLDHWSDEAQYSLPEADE